MHKKWTLGKIKREISEAYELEWESLNIDIFCICSSVRMFNVLIYNWIAGNWKFFAMQIVRSVNPAFVTCEIQIRDLNCQVSTKFRTMTVFITFEIIIHRLFIAILRFFSHGVCIYIGYFRRTPNFKKT